MRRGLYYQVDGRRTSSLQAPPSLTTRWCFCYDVGMKYFYALLLWLVVCAPAAAFSPVLTEVTRPYEIVTIEEEDIQNQAVLGELEGFPIMYEVTSDEPFTLQAAVRQRFQSSAEPIGFSLIAIRQNERGGGVTEVARLRPEPADWQRVKDARLGMSFWQSSDLLVDVEPGTYRVEISTPENMGKYLLSFGAGDVNDGYFATVAGIQRTQKFFGFSFLKLLTSSYVYYPLGILLILFLMQRAWKYRKLITNHAA